jgi:hypothetical protein
MLKQRVNLFPGFPVKNSVTALKYSHCPDWRAGSAADFERQPNESKATPAHQLVCIHHILVMSEAHFPADMVDFLIRNVAHTRGSGFYTKCRNAMPSQPAGGGSADAGSMLPANGAKARR